MSDDFTVDDTEQKPELTREELIEIREAFFAFSREDRVRPKVDYFIIIINELYRIKS